MVCEKRSKDKEREKEEERRKMEDDYVTNAV